MTNIANWKDPPFYSWVNPLFLWSFSIAMLNYQRVLRCETPKIIWCPTGKPRLEVIFKTVHWSCKVVMGYSRDSLAGLWGGRPNQWNMDSTWIHGALKVMAFRYYLESHQYLLKICIINKTYQIKGCFGNGQSTIDTTRDGFPLKFWRSLKISGSERCKLFKGIQYPLVI